VRPINIVYSKVKLSPVTGRVFQFLEYQMMDKVQKLSGFEKPHGSQSPNQNSSPELPMYDSTKQSTMMSGILIVQIGIGHNPHSVKLKSYKFLHKY
jgi:hypothetical protein